MFSLNHLAKQLSILIALILGLTIFHPVEAISTQAQDAITWPIYHEIVLDETRGWIYGSDTAGNKIDVISMSTLELLKSYKLSNGSSPHGIALSPDGQELAVTQNGLGAVLFLLPDTGTVNASLAANEAQDFIYGREGRAYLSVGSSIYVVDVATHTKLSQSPSLFVYTPFITITADKNILYSVSDYNATSLYKFDVSTDTITLLKSTSPASLPPSPSPTPIAAADDLIYTKTGWVWNSDLERVGATGVQGNFTLVPVHNAIAVSSSDMGGIAFADKDTFYVSTIYSLAGQMGPVAATTDGTKLFVNTSNGMVEIDLASFPPGDTKPLPAGTLPYADLVLDEAHGVLFGSNTGAHKVDVISAVTLDVVQEIRFNNGSAPMQMDLRPDGNELAVALNGASQIAFIDTNTLQFKPSAMLSTRGWNKNMPFDVKYGRPGRLYSSGETDFTGFDFIHIVDTSTYTEVAVSDVVAEYRPYLTVTADGMYLLVNDHFVPNSLHKYNVETDILSDPTVLRNNFDADTYLLLEDQSRVFTSFGQVWTYTADMSASVKLWENNLVGKVVDLSALNMVAYLGSPGMVYFVSTQNYSVISTIDLPFISEIASGMSNQADTKMFLNTNLGVKVLSLDPALPAQLIPQSGSGQSSFLSTQFTSPLVVKVENYLGQPVSGIPVTFAAPPNGAGAIFVNSNTPSTTVISDGSGMANSSFLRANGRRGSYTVSALATDVASVGVFTLSNFSNLLEDPSFEAFTSPLYWDQSSTNFWTPLCTYNTCEVGGNAGPRTGVVWGRFGGTRLREKASVSQEVVIPVGHPNLKLQFYLWIGQAEFGSDKQDAFIAEVDGIKVFSANATQIGSYSSYTPVSVNMAAFADGAKHTISFESITDGQIVIFNLDDVTLTDAIFHDVVSDYWAMEYIERLFEAGVTGGCSENPMSYCPDIYVNRAQMAVFLLRGEHGSSYSPPASTGTVFGDVPQGYWASAWIEQLALEEITGGCGEGNYCPEYTVTRDQMAVFLLRAKYGSSYSPPPATGLFADVPVEYWAAPWIEQLAAEGITGGCGNGNYCPGSPVTRAQMAVFLVKAFGLP